MVIWTSWILAVSLEGITIDKFATSFILPPSLDVLEQRLNQRGQDSDEVIASRMAKAVDEMSHFNEFGHIIINDDFATALNELEAIVTAQRLRSAKQQIRHQPLFDSLLGTA